MYVCMYVYIYTYVCMYICKYIYIYISIFIFIFYPKEDTGTLNHEPEGSKHCRCMAVQPQRGRSSGLVGAFFFFEGGGGGGRRKQGGVACFDMARV